MYACVYKRACQVLTRKCPEKKRKSVSPSHSQRAGPDLPGVLLCVIAVQAVSRGATLTAAVATGAAAAALG